MSESISWKDSLRSFFHPRVISMLFFGFSAGLPLLLIFASLSWWLREAGVERSAVTYFSWAALAYSFKFVWAPIVDTLPVPFLTRRLGKRRAWLLVSQLSIAVSIALMGSVDPQTQSLFWLACFTVMLGFSSATQDIVIDAYRIESVREELQAMMSSAYIAGYRVGMVASGAGALFFADYFGSSGAYVYSAWQLTYYVMALLALVGFVTSLVISEPDHPGSQHHYAAQQYLRFLMLFMLAISAFVLTYWSTIELAQHAKVFLKDTFYNKALANFLVEAVRLGCGGLSSVCFVYLLAKTSLYEKQLVDESYVRPVKDFFDRYGFRFALWLLVLIGLYRISDIVLGVIANVFYKDMGFSKPEVASVVKTFGLLVTIAGGFLGGVLAMRFGVIRILYLGAVLTVVTNLLFMVLSEVGYSMPWLYVVITADNLSAGIASAAFVAFLSSLTNVSFTAMQYAIFSSLMTLIPKVIGGYSGSMVDNLGYTAFFFIASLMGIPVLLLISRVDRQLKARKAAHNVHGP